MADSLPTRVLSAVADAVRTLDTGGQVIDGRVYVRPALEYAPERDGFPAVLVGETPGVPAAAVNRMGGSQKRDWTLPVTVILAGPHNRRQTRDDPAAPDPDWRAKWRDALIDRLHGKTLPGVSEVQRVFFDGAVTLDMTAYELSNLWWTAATFRVLCRVTRS